MVSLSLGNLCLEQEGDKGLVLVRQESCAGKQRRCPPVCALLSRKKVTQKPFELEEEKWERNPLGPARVFSQQEMLKVLRMEQSSPGLLSAHMSSSCSADRGAAAASSGVSQNCQGKSSDSTFKMNLAKL